MSTTLRAACVSVALSLGMLGQAAWAQQPQAVEGLALAPAEPVNKRPYTYQNHLHDRKYGYFGPLEPGPFYGGHNYERYTSQRRSRYEYRAPYYRSGSATVGPRRLGW